MKWTGFRYYMVKYYYSCYLIGTIIFFMVSAGVGFSLVIQFYYLIIEINYKYGYMYMNDDINLTNIK